MKLRASFFFAVSVVMLAALLSAGERSDYLQPSDGLFAGFGPEPYDIALRETLLGEHNYRQCQMLVVPAFGPEWAVYLVKDNSGKSLVIYRAMKANLWYQMCDKIQTNTKSSAYRIDGADAVKALSQLKKEVVSAEALLSENATVLLAQIWAGMLAQVRYPQERSVGLDGVDYHAAHWERGLGFRSSEIWSPDKGSRTAALVELTEQLRDYALAKEKERPSHEAAITEKAKALILRLK